MQVHPLTPDRWDDFAQLFGPRGAYGGCWCMWWRLKRSKFEQNGNKGNRNAIHALVKKKVVTGILGYEGDEPVGWCSVAPREDFGSLERSRVLKRLDDEPVWSIVCLFVTKSRRGHKLALKMIEAAVAYARKQGAGIVEAYPTDPRGKELPPVSSFMGTPELFAQAGFRECARPSAAKVVMRRRL